MDTEEQRERIGKALKAIEAACGKKPAGFRAPIGDLMLETLDIAREYGMTYSSDLYDDDRPYFMKTNEKGDKILQIPQQWANFDLPYFAFNYRSAFPFGQGRVANYSNVFPTGKMSLPVITTITSATICSWTRSQPEVRDVSTCSVNFWSSCAPTRAYGL